MNLFTSLRGFGLALGLLCLAATQASAGVTDTWQHSRGDFRLISPGNWQEHDAKGKKLFSFKETARGADAIHIHDARRGITVVLTETQATVFQNSKNLGAYTGRFIFSVFGYDGGEFRSVGKGRWEEFQDGRKVFTFIELVRGGGIIPLFDASRGITVEISSSQFSVSSGGSVIFTKAGKFIR